MRAVYFSAGCFWGVEEKFSLLEGVEATSVGYMGGFFKNPKYNNVSKGITGHAETVEVIYNPYKISYKDLCLFFFNIHDSTSLNKQGVDKGTQYKSIVFYNNKRDKKIYNSVLDTLKYKKNVKTLLLDKNNHIYYLAENYHQHYIKKKNNYLKLI